MKEMCKRKSCGNYNTKICDKNCSGYFMGRMTQKEYSDLTANTQREKNYKFTHIQPERLNPETSKEDVIV